jgi:subtilisin family serine protease
VLVAAVQAAAAAGSLIIAPAGDLATGLPNYPASLPEVLSVSAVGPTRALAPYSSFGSTSGAKVDLAAPGGDLTSDASKGIEVPVWDFAASSAKWTSAQGTALAAAHVAGVAALLLAKEPGLTAAQLRARLTTYATAMGNADLFGAGLLNAFSSLEQGGDFRHDMYVRAIDVSTGAIAGTVKASADGTFRLAHLAPGTSYRIYAGQDEEGDGVIGTPGRVWGALGGSASPTTVDTPATQVYQVTFGVALPIESGFNTQQLRPDPIPVGGWLDAEVKLGESDWYTVTLPAGTYTFGTAGRTGACGLALNANTKVDVYDHNGLLVGTNDDGTGYDYCGKVTLGVAAGVYTFSVQGSNSVTFRGVDQAAGYYRVYVR